MARRAAAPAAPVQPSTSTGSTKRVGGSGNGSTDRSGVQGSSKGNVEAPPPCPAAKSKDPGDPALRGKTHESTKRTRTPGSTPDDAGSSVGSSGGNSPPPMRTSSTTESSVTPTPQAGSPMGSPATLPTTTVGSTPGSTPSSTLAGSSEGSATPVPTGSTSGNSKQSKPGFAPTLSTGTSVGRSRSLNVSDLARTLEKVKVKTNVRGSDKRKRRMARRAAAPAAPVQPSTSTGSTKRVGGSGNGSTDRSGVQGSSKGNVEAPPSCPAAKSEDPGDLALRGKTHESTKRTRTPGSTLNDVTRALVSWDAPLSSATDLPAEGPKDQPIETVSVDEETPADDDRQPPAEPSHADEETLTELDDETLTEDNVNSPLAESGQEGGAQDASPDVDIASVVKEVIGSQDFLQVIASMIKDAVSSKIDECLKFHEEIITKLVSENNNLKLQVHSLSVQMDKTEQYSRRNNILILGVPEEDKEKTVDTVSTIIKSKMDINLSTDNIDRCHRIGSFENKDKKRPILVTFDTYKTKKMVFDKKKNLRSTGITFKEDLTHIRVRMYKMAMEKLNFKNVWSIDGAVFTKVGSQIKKFEDPSILEEYLQSLKGP
ncbi:unnamed protein product [Phaedon cochleariae]|uniref:Uncharacterized protein n=1 Tax=Phaedon cochleariae TaxID=80249 RepID=A0A9N9SDY3_PHACE|nr:unnamed protein product [Phaedon cochleariae]